jgi:putative endonuclease
LFIHNAAIRDLEKALDMNDRNYHVYILASKPRGVLYVGVSNDLVSRVYIHRNELVEGFTKKYYVHKLVYFETFEDRDEALKKEKLLKKWRREWKIELIEKGNPNWDDLYDTINQ